MQFVCQVWWFAKVIYWFVNMGREAGKLSTLAGQLDYYVPIWWNKLAAWGYGPDKHSQGVGLYSSN